MPLKKSKIPILFLGSQMEMAGAQRVLLSQAQWFHRKGYPAQEVFFYDKQDLKKEWQAKYPPSLVSLDAWKKDSFFPFNFFRLVRGQFRLYRLLRKGVLVIVTFTPHSNLLGLPIAWLAGVPVRIGTHHGYIEGSSIWLAWLHGRLTNSRLCNLMVAVSSQVRANAIKHEGARPQRLVVIENGIDSLPIKRLSPRRRGALRAELGIPDKGLLALTVGRMTVQKGHTVLLDAIAKLGNLRAKVIFALAGDGPKRMELEAKAVRLGIADQIRFLGVRRNVNELLLAADLFIQPSLWEGLSLALLEALLAGLPVLATAVEGVVDVVEDESSALLVPPNDPKATAESIERLLNDGRLRKRLGRAGQQRAETYYSVDKMCKSYEALMHGLLINGG